MIVGCYKTYEKEPEPQEYEYLLVKQINRQNTLHDIAVRLGEMSYREVAHRHSREALVCHPIRVSYSN